MCFTMSATGSHNNVNEITQKLQQSSLRDEASNLQSATINSQTLPSPLALTRQTVQQEPLEPAENNNNNIYIVSCNKPSPPVIRNTGTRLSLPFNGGNLPASQLNTKFQASASNCNEATSINKALLQEHEIEIEELPIKRRHCSWAAHDFKLHGKSNFRPLNSGDMESVELLKPVPIRPVLCSFGTRDDFGLMAGRYPGVMSVPRPSSASSGIFDLDTGSECSKRDIVENKLDRSASNGWSSSADERRRSDEDTSRQFAVVSRGHHRTFARHHCRGSANHRVSSSGGFLPLGTKDERSLDDQNTYYFQDSTVTNSLAVPPSTSTSSTSKSAMSSNWCRSAPDLNCVARLSNNDRHDGDENDSWRRTPRKRNLSGRLQARPSIDLFKNVTDDDSSCGGESSECFGRISDASIPYSRGGGETEYDGDTDSDDANSLAASSRSTAATFSAGCNSSASEPTPVTRSLSYPWLRSQQFIEHDDHGKCCGEPGGLSLPIRKAISIIRRGSSRTGNNISSLIDDGLRTIVGSPADTIAAMAVRNSGGASSNANLLSLVADSICSSSDVSGCIMPELLDDEKVATILVADVTQDSSHADSISHSSNVDAVALTPRFHDYHSEIDIDLIEQN